MGKRRSDSSSPRPTFAGTSSNEQVAVTGDVEIADYPERGKVMIFRATSAAAMDEEPG